MIDRPPAFGVPSGLPACLPAYLPTNLPAILYSCLPVQMCRNTCALHTYVFTYQRPMQVDT